MVFSFVEKLNTDIANIHERSRKNIILHVLCDRVFFLSFIKSIHNHGTCLNRICSPIGWLKKVSLLELIFTQLVLLRINYMNRISCMNKKVWWDDFENIDNNHFVSDWFYHKYCRMCYDCGFTNIFSDRISKQIM